MVVLVLTTMHHVGTARVATKVAGLVGVMLITLFHAKPSSILIGQFELSLVAFALAAFGEGVYTRLLNTFPHILAHMLGLYLLLAAGNFRILSIAEAIGVQKQT